VPGRSAEPSTPSRIGIINIMPKVEAYEPYLLTALRDAPGAAEPIWIRLRSHVYSSSDAEHIRARYVTFDEAMRQRPLDGLVLTGAPVEELRFEDVHYWPELSEILQVARRAIKSTFGICWGGLALGELLELEKTMYGKKLFGVFDNRPLDAQHPIVGGSDDRFWCAHSRHSGIRDDELEQAERAGIVTLLAHGAETGYSMFESADHRYVAHLGHPEYDPARLIHEWQRDNRLGRADVEAPRNLDPERPLHVWRSHRRHVFSKWLELVATLASI